MHAIPADIACLYWNALSKKKAPLFLRSRASKGCMKRIFGLGIQEFFWIICWKRNILRLKAANDLIWQWFFPNYDILTIQTLLGHSYVRTTMIYTRCFPSETVKEAKSPLDF